MTTDEQSKKLEQARSEAVAKLREFLKVWEEIDKAEGVPSDLHTQAYRGVMQVAHALDSDTMPVVMRTPGLYMVMVNRGDQQVHITVETIEADETDEADTD